MNDGEKSLDDGVRPGHASSTCVTAGALAAAQAYAAVCSRLRALTTRGFGSSGTGARIGYYLPAGPEQSHGSERGDTVLTAEHAQRGGWAA